VTVQPIRGHAALHLPEGSDSNFTGALHVVGAGGEPAFQNGWSGTASFRMILGALIDLGASGRHVTEISMSVSGGTAGTAVFTLPAAYAPLTDTPYLVGIDSSSVVFAWQVLATGDVLMGV